MRDEDVLTEVADVLGEDPAGHRAGAAFARDEEVHIRLVEVQRPGRAFVLGLRCQMQCHRRQRVLEHRVMLIRIAQRLIRQMKIIVDVERAEVGTGKQGIATAHKVRADINDGGVWINGVHLLLLSVRRSWVGFKPDGPQNTRKNAKFGTFGMRNFSVLSRVSRMHSHPSTPAIASQTRSISASVL